MFNRVVSSFVFAVVLGIVGYADVVPQDLGSIRVNTPMYTAEGVDNIVSNVVDGIERDNITDGTNTIDAAGGVYVKRGVGDDWTLVSGKYHTNTPVWITKEDKEKAVEKTGWYGYGIEEGYQFLSEDFYAIEITGVVKGLEYDSEVGGMVYHVSTNTWSRTNTEDQFIGRLALTNDIQEVFQLSTNAANNLITEATNELSKAVNLKADKTNVYTKAQVDTKISISTNGFLRAEQDPAFTVWTNGMSVAAGRDSQANATGATALGYGAHVNNKYGIAVGGGIVQNNGDYAIAIGMGSVASGTYDTALGQRITMNGPYGAAVGAYSSVVGSYGSAIGPYSHAEFKATALGNNSYAPSQSFGITYDPEHFYFTSSNNTTVSKRGINKKSLQAYLNERVATNAIANVAMSGAYSDLTGTPTNVSVFSNDAGYVTAAVTNGLASSASVDAKIENAVLPTDPTFSNAVLAVSLNIDTNSVAVLNEIASTFGGFPIEGAATTVGGLLAALAAAVAWLKKHKIEWSDAESGAMSDVFRADTELSDCGSAQDVAIRKLSQLLGENVAGY